VSLQTSTRTSTLPRVNLLPPEIGEKRRLQQVQGGVVAAVVLSIAAVAFLDVQGGHSVTAAKQKVNTAAAKNSQLTRQLASYSDVKTTAAQLAASQALLSQAMSTEVQWSTYLADFSVILPPTTWLTSVTMSSTLPAGSLTSSTAAPGEIGTVSVQGVAMKYDNLADWLDSLKPERGLASVYFSNAAEQYIGATKTVGFQASANLTSDALCQNAGGC
jgi:Tfp pilus assembly protein PilN